MIKSMAYGYILKADGSVPERIPVNANCDLIEVTIFESHPSQNSSHPSQNSCHMDIPLVVNRDEEEYTFMLLMDECNDPVVRQNSDLPINLTLTALHPGSGYRGNILLVVLVGDNKVATPEFDPLTFLYFMEMVESEFSSEKTYWHLELLPQLTASAIDMEESEVKAEIVPTLQEQYSAFINDVITKIVRGQN